MGGGRAFGVLQEGQPGPPGRGVSTNGGGVGLRGGSWWVGPEVVGWFGSVVAEWADLMWLGVECYSTPRV